MNSAQDGLSQKAKEQIEEDGAAACGLSPVESWDGGQDLELGSLLLEILGLRRRSNHSCSWVDGT